jgi:hypothetical protein
MAGSGLRNRTYEPHHVAWGTVVASPGWICVPCCRNLSSCSSSAADLPSDVVSSHRRPAIGMSSRIRWQIPPIRLAIFSAWNRAPRGREAPVVGNGAAGIGGVPVENRWEKEDTR